MSRIHQYSRVSSCGLGGSYDDNDDDENCCNFLVPESRAGRSDCQWVFPTQSFPLITTTTYIYCYGEIKVSTIFVASKVSGRPGQECPQTTYANSCVYKPAPSRFPGSKPTPTEVSNLPPPQVPGTEASWDRGFLRPRLPGTEAALN